MENEPRRVNIAGAGVDWVTATSASTIASKELWWLGEGLTLEEEEAGDERRSWACHGYNGWSCGGCCYGARGDGVLIRLSGALADDHWRETLRWASNVSRLDVQVTVDLDQPDGGIADDLYNSLTIGSRREGRPLSGRLIRGTDGGQTCYIGARASRYMGRVYDKGVEAGSAQAGLTWRYEVEAKKEATEVPRAYLEGAEDPAAASALFVRDWFTHRGLEVPFHMDSSFAYREPRVDRKADKQLQWLARGVRPVVQRLLARRDRQSVLTALGLYDAATRDALQPPAAPNA